MRYLASRSNNFHPGNSQVFDTAIIFVLKTVVLNQKMLFAIDFEPQTIQNFSKTKL